MSAHHLTADAAPAALAVGAPATAVDALLLAAVEEAGLNASAAPEQHWLDGWLLRTCAVKAKRSRCIYPLAPGRLALPERLDRARVVFRAAGLPLVLRVTGLLGVEADGGRLDDALDRLGLARIDDTRVMVNPDLAGTDLSGALAPGISKLQSGARVEPCGAAAYAELIGALRGTPTPQRNPQARRLLNAPVPHHAYAIKTPDGDLLACGQYAREDRRVGLYDIYVPPPHRGLGWGRRLCRTLLALARDEGARVAYLQVEANNAPARAVYRGLGFADGYGYHYRCDDPAAAS
jgi:ribosomal protein S18 acetylase RimI-like enzyme